MKDVNWTQVLELATVVAGLLGLNHAKDRALDKAKAFKKAAIAKGRELAHELAAQLRAGVIDAQRMVFVWQRRLEEWALEQGKKLPDPLRAEALAAAKAAFHEVHVYLDPIAEKAAWKNLEQAVGNFERAMVEIHANIQKFPKGKPRGGGDKPTKPPLPA